MAHFALIGAGYWGKNILRNTYELGLLDTVCETDKGLVAEYRKKYAGLKFTGSFADVIADPAITAVLIATPAVTHFDLAKKALCAGKDVYVEKPLALTAKEGEELVALAGREGRVLMVGHILHYHPAVKTLKKIIQEGQLGKIRYIYSNRLNIGKLRTEENILWSFAPHDISIVLMLLDEEPESVRAFGGDYLTPGIHDVTMTEMEFRNGVKGHVFVSWLHPFKEQKLVVVGSKAMAVFDDTTTEKLFLYPHKIEWKNGKIPVAEKAAHQVIPCEAGEPLKLELQHFADCVATRATPETDGGEGLRVLRILERAEQSLKKTAPPAKAPVQKEYSAHETALVDEGARVGTGTQIWHFSHILKDTTVGKNCRIGQNVVIGPHASVGDGCKIQNNVSLYEGVELGDFVFCGPSCVFTNVNNPRCEVPRMKELRKTVVKRGASIGANATVVCGHTLGSYCFVGAGSVVTRDVPDFALVYGNPAVIRGWMCECGVKLGFKKDKAVCGACGKEYRLKDGVVRQSK